MNTNVLTGARGSQLWMYMVEANDLFNFSEVNAIAQNSSKGVLQMKEV